MCYDCQLSKTLSFKRWNITCFPDLPLKYFNMSQLPLTKVKIKYYVLSNFDITVMMKYMFSMTNIHNCEVEILHVGKDWAKSWWQRVQLLLNRLGWVRGERGLGGKGFNCCWIGWGLVRTERRVGGKGFNCCWIGWGLVRAERGIGGAGFTLG